MYGLDERSISKMINNIFNYQSSSINSIYSTKAINNNAYAYLRNRFNPYQKSAYNLYDKSNAKFISDYTTKLFNLKEINSKLSSENKNSVLNTIAASSSNNKVAVAQSFFTVKEKATYELNVSKTAKAQINTSNALESNSISDMDVANINISSKGKSYSFTIDTFGLTNKESLQNLASKINKSNIGISAIVKNKDNESSLELRSDKTGQGENFTVSGSDKIMLNTNLSNITQVAEDAVFDVTKDGTKLAQNKKSSTNEIDVDGYKVSATIKDVGTTTISLGTDKKKITDSVENFVSAYNNTIDFLEKSLDKGSAISRQLENLKIPDINKTTLASIGINLENNGKLSVDGKTLDKALDENLSKVENTLSSRYSAFNRLDNKINGALKESSINLIDSSIYEQEGSSNNPLFERLNMFSIYSGGSAFGMINPSAIGLMLNMFA
jgi:flagellar capping protein FliD